MLEINKIYNEDCLMGMQKIDDKSIDMILCDLPYGTTGCKWDAIIPFDKLWEQYKRIIKDNGAIILFAVNPFASNLIMSNPKMYRYEWIWDKTRGSNFQQANFAPMKSHEQILVFSKKPAIYTKKGSMVYYPQKTEGKEYISKMGNSGNIVRDKGNNSLKKIETKQSGRYPLSIQTFKKDGKIHPTQKPVSLLEYLIRTYTSENELILDNCMGSGSTAIACLKTNRNYIGFENDNTYFELANKRIEEHIHNLDNKI